MWNVEICLRVTAADGARLLGSAGFLLSLSKISRAGGVWLSNVQLTIYFCGSVCESFPELASPVTVAINKYFTYAHKAFQEIPSLVLTFYFSSRVLIACTPRVKVTNDCSL